MPFEDIESLLSIKLTGGGGTDFRIIFEYVHGSMQDDLPACIIILTDGICSFLEEPVAKGIPVLWLINNETHDPPWGKVARIEV